MIEDFNEFSHVEEYLSSDIICFAPLSACWNCWHRAWCCHPQGPDCISRRFSLDYWCSLPFPHLWPMLKTARKENTKQDQRWCGRRNVTWLETSPLTFETNTFAHAPFWRRNEFFLLGLSFCLCGRLSPHSFIYSFLYSFMSTSHLVYVSLFFHYLVFRIIFVVCLLFRVLSFVCTFVDTCSFRWLCE